MGERDLGQYVAAFARVAGGASLVVAAPVLVATLTRGASVVPVGADVWRDGWLPVLGERGRLWENLFTGATFASVAIDGHAALPLAEVFRDFPVAALLAR